MRCIGPAGGDAGTNRFAGPDIDDAGGIGVVAHGIAGAACHGRRCGTDIRVRAAAQWRPLC